MCTPVYQCTSHSLLDSSEQRGVLAAQKSEALVELQRADKVQKIQLTELGNAIKRRKPLPPTHTHTHTHTHTRAHFFIHRADGDTHVTDAAGGRESRSRSGIGTWVWARSARRVASCAAERR